MLKGTVTFETFDKNGKLIQRETAENMVTDAVDKILAMSPWWDENVSAKLPLAQNILGGLYLFDEQLTESRANYHLPGNAKITGMGGRLTDLTNPFRGTLDDTVTGPIENGYKNVWKFTESQANGRIASAALTSKEAGAGMLYNFIGSYNPPRMMETMNRIGTYGFIAGGSGLVPIMYDEENEEIYYGILSRPSNYVFTIYKRKFPLYSFGVNDGGNPGNIDLVYPATTIGTIEGYENFTESKMINGQDGYMYQFDSVYGTSMIVEGQTVYGVLVEDLRRINLADLKNGTITLETFGDMLYPMPDTGNPIKFTFNGGYFYATRSGQNDEMRRYSVTNPSSYIDYTPEDAQRDAKSSIESNFKLYSLQNGLVVSTLASTDYNSDLSTIIYYPDGKYIKVTNGCTYTEPDLYVFDLDLVRFWRYGSGGYRMNILQEYLGTIFNLPAAVNKNDTMTMTVTYTLTNVTENS